VEAVADSEGVALVPAETRKTPSAFPENGCHGEKIAVLHSVAEQTAAGGQSQDAFPLENPVEISRHRHSTP